MNTIQGNFKKIKNVTKKPISNLNKKFLKENIIKLKIKYKIIIYNYIKLL